MDELFERQMCKNFNTFHGICTYISAVTHNFDISKCLTHGNVTSKPRNTRWFMKVVPFLCSSDATHKNIIRLSKCPFQQYYTISAFPPNSADTKYISPFLYTSSLLMHCPITDSPQGVCRVCSFCGSEWLISMSTP